METREEEFLWDEKNHLKSYRKRGINNSKDHKFCIYPYIVENIKRKRRISSCARTDKKSVKSGKKFIDLNYIQLNTKHVREKRTTAWDLKDDWLLSECNNILISFFYFFAICGPYVSHKCKFLVIKSNFSALNSAKQESATKKIKICVKTFSEILFTLRIIQFPRQIKISEL